MVSAIAAILAALPSGAAPPLANDAFRRAETIRRLPFTDAGSIGGATREAGEQVCGPMGDATVWYRLTPAAAVRVRIDTEGSNYDTTIGLWKGTTLASLELMRCNDDFQSLQSLIVGSLAAGETYYIQVGGFFESVGSFTLNVADAGTTEDTRRFTASPLLLDCSSPDVVGGVCYGPDVAGAGDTMTLEIAGDDGAPVPAMVFAGSSQIPVCGSAVIVVPGDAFEVVVEIGQQHALNCPFPVVAVTGDLAVTFSAT